MEQQAKTTGRGQDIGAETKRKVMQESHGRCMFKGCGQDLGLDELTGTEGNFSYLAHNIASAESGARGVEVLSEKLSNDPKNILLMCDKHHRLIDKVAAVSYPASLLSEMRREFCDTVDELLNGLSFDPIPAYSVLWPVHGQVVSQPSELQINQCLNKMGARLDGRINDISNNETLLRESSPDLMQPLMIEAINIASENITLQSRASNYRTGVSAFGPMPALIGLGARIGNKNEITPMLRYRDDGHWGWPADQATAKFYEFMQLESLADNEPDIVVSVAFTAFPKILEIASSDIANNLGAKVVLVKAKDNQMGNGCLAHPKNGTEFMKDMQELFLKLRDRHGVLRIHILPCASNAACVFLGKAFDNHHPDLIIYDFEEGTMVPKFRISNENSKCVIGLAT